jgi:hypothetical protein
MLGILAGDQNDTFGMGHRERHAIEGVFIHDDDALLARVGIRNGDHVPRTSVKERIPQNRGIHGIGESELHGLHNLKASGPTTPRRYYDAL